MSSLLIRIPSCDNTGSVHRSPFKLRKHSLMGLRSMMSLKISTPSAVVSFLGTPNKPPNTGCPPTWRASESRILPQIPLARRPRATSSQHSSGIMTRGGRMYARSFSGFNHRPGSSMYSLKPPSQTWAAGTIPATPAFGRLSHTFSHRTVLAT